MKLLRNIGYVLFFYAISIFSVHAEEAKGTRAEAQRMVEAAIARIKEVGPEKAFDEFTSAAASGNSKWKDRDLYLFCYKMDGVNTCHGANKALVGKNLWQLKTADGKLLMQEFASLVKTKGSGWVDYKWPHPQTKTIEDKTAYIVKIPDYDGYIGAGVYATH